MSTNASSYPWEFSYTLSDKCTFQDIHEPPGIQLTIENNEDGTKTVSGFRIRVNSPTQENANDTAERQAKKFVDILAVISTIPLGFTFTSVEMYRPDGKKRITSFTAKYEKFVSGKPLELSKGNIPKLINTLNLQGKDQQLVDGLASASAGLKAYRNGMYEVMIRDFYLVIEKEVDDRKFPRGIKYKYLRHALSHSGRLRDSTKKGLLKHFKQGYFDFTTNCEFDHSSPKNRRNVMKEAMKLRKIALAYMRRQLPKQRSRH